MATEMRYETTEPGMSAMDYREHEKTYSLFLGLTKGVSISVAVGLVLMAVLLTGGDSTPPAGPNASTAGAATGAAPAAPAQ